MLPIPYPGVKPIQHIKNGKFNVADLFVNKNHWIEYDGTDTNVPCGPTANLISYQPMIIGET